MYIRKPEQGEVVFECWIFQFKIENIIRQNGKDKSIKKTLKLWAGLF